MFTRDVKIVSIDSNECTKEVWQYQVEPNKIRVMISMSREFKEIEGKSHLNAHGRNEK